MNKKISRPVKNICRNKNKAKNHKYDKRHKEVEIIDI
jgi:hypothetical protein